MIRIVLGVFIALMVAAAPVAAEPSRGTAGDASRGTAGDASRFAAGDVVIEAPWLRATPRGAQVAGGYMRITNRGSADDRLIGGTLAQTNRFELHEMAMEGTVMRMRPVAGGLPIKAGETVELKPGGLHVMGLGLQGAFTAGQTVKGTLQFEKAGTVQVEYSVAPIGAGAPGGH